MKTILVIEDVAPLRQEILETLLCLNYQAIEAENGEIGVNLAQTYQPDLILCDIMMPGIDGYEVYRCLQDDPNTATIPFIFLSAKADRGDVRRGMNLGADDYLTKPFTSEELSDAISARIHKQDNQTQFYETGLKQATSSLTSLAYRDPLTGLPNRIQLYRSLQDAIKQLDDSGPSVTPPPLIAILWLRIDDFAALVDSSGDVAGDWLLKEVSQRLTSNMTKRDLAARLSRDEFCVVISGHSQKQTIVNIANQLHHQLIAPYQFGEQRFSIQVTGGISLYPDHNTNCDQLLQLAYRAMNYADQCGGNYCALYDTDTDVLVQQRQWLEANLGTALAQSEFRLYYQPQINLITGRVVGAEALLRWQHPKLGLITPKQFIALAEVGGSIIPIGLWVLQTACTQVKAWRDSALFPVTIAVNLSATELLQERLIDHITDVLQETGCSADMLCVEVTEVGVMKNLEVIAAVLRNLKAMGIRISLDDFGTGYSSLNYLHQLPIDFLKIDTSTIHNLPKDSSSIAIVTSMIALAQSQKLKVIAEGVETQEQLDFLRKHGCHMMQGNLYSPPIPNPEFEVLLASDRRLS